MDYADRPDDMLARQMDALRNAARFRNKETGARHFAHLPQFRKAFIRGIMAIRKVQRERMKGGAA